MRALQHFALWCLGLSAAQTQTTAAERDCLARHATRKTRLAEIGVWHGVTTRRLRQAMSRDGELLAVDPYPRGRLGLSLQQIIAHREVARVPNGKVRWLRTTGAEAGAGIARDGRGDIEFVFIDGDHSYDGLRRDWEAWSGLIAPGGIVALHDSQSTPLRDLASAGSAIFTREVVRKDSRFQLVEVVDSLTVMRRLPGSSDRNDR